MKDSGKLFIALNQYFALFFNLPRLEMNLSFQYWYHFHGIVLEKHIPNYHFWVYPLQQAYALIKFVMDEEAVDQIQQEYFLYLYVSVW